MATNLVYRNDNKKNRVRDLGETIAPGTAVLTPEGEPAVAVTGSADYTVSEVIDGVGTLSGIPAGGVGLEGQEVTLAYDGTFEFDDITGAAGLEVGDPVYITGTGALNAAGTDVFGTVDFVPDYDTTRGFVPVKIGA